MGLSFFDLGLSAGCSKKLIKQVQCRLKLLKNKKSVIAKQLREDVMELIKNGYEQTAFNRVSPNTLKVSNFIWF